MEVFEIIKKERPIRPPRKEKLVQKQTVDQKVEVAKKKGKKTWFGKRNRY
jgi:hypothetical protein